jgi:hypothetical protein
MRKLALALLVCVGPSFGAGLASRPADDTAQAESSKLEGFYAALGGGGALVIVSDSNGFGYDAELRLGYSFNPGLQIFLSAALDGATVKVAGADFAFRSELFAAFVQYHFFHSGNVGVYGRAGIGVGLSGSFGPSNAVGLAEAGGLGVEIRLAPGLFLAPELFYKTANLSISGAGSTTEQVVGLQLALIYY